MRTLRAAVWVHVDSLIAIVVVPARNDVVAKVQLRKLTSRDPVILRIRIVTRGIERRAAACRYAVINANVAARSDHQSLNILIQDRVRATVG